MCGEQCVCLCYHGHDRWQGVVSRMPSSVIRVHVRQQGVVQGVMSREPTSVIMVHVR